MTQDLATRPSPDPDAAPTAPADAWIRPATRWVALLLISAVVLYLCWLIVSPFVDVILWSVVLVVVFGPVHRRIRERVRSSNGAAAISCVLVILAILLPLTLITVMIAHDAGRVADAIQQHKDEWLDPDAPTVVGRALRWVERFVDVDRVASRAYLADRMRTISGTLAARTLNLVGGVLGVVV